MGMRRFVPAGRQWWCQCRLGLPGASDDVAATKIWRRACAATEFGLNRYDCGDLDLAARIRALVSDALVGPCSRWEVFGDDRDADQRAFRPKKRVV